MVIRDFRSSGIIIIIGSFLLLLLGAITIKAQTLYDERPFQPCELRGAILSDFYDVPPAEIYMFAYSAGDELWQMIPFQIDERVQQLDEHFPTRAPRHFYVVETAYTSFSPQDTNAHFDNDDELVFMIGDLGDKAPLDSWIDNEDSRNYNRLEIKLNDLNNTDITAYGYLYRSSTLTIPPEVANKYQMSFEPDHHTADTKFYSLGLSHGEGGTGIVTDVTIKPDWGTGVDIFDTQKFRLNGALQVGNLSLYPGSSEESPSFTERLLYLFKPSEVEFHYLGYSKTPVVRIIREARYALAITMGPQVIFPLPDASFFIIAKYYPYNAQMLGGHMLTPEALHELLGSDAYIEVSYIRQSWDYNSAASGMKFYNAFNTDILVDGNVDTPDETITTPIEEWSMVTGTQGTMLTYVEFEENLWDEVELYYHDNKNGKQGDSTYVIGDDTGFELGSYGDYGIQFINNIPCDTIDLNFGFNAYFLEHDRTVNDAESIVYTIKNPIVAHSSASNVSAVEDELSRVNDYALYPNYPNPFNNQTVISFSLPGTNHVSLKIIDTNGRTVIMLTDRIYCQGAHKLYWNGRNAKNEIVASGVYFYELRTQHFVEKRKMLFVQ